MTAEIIGWGLTIVALIGGIIARDRFILTAISNGDKACRDDAERRYDVLHERVNKTRDDFVRRDDLDNHMTRIEKTIASMHDEQKETNKRIDNFMATLVNNKDRQA